MLKAKENQPNLLADCKYLFDNESDNILRDEVVEKDHGRIEKRKYYLYNNSRNTIIDPKWDRIVNSIGMVKSTVSEKGKVREEMRYFVTSLMTVVLFATSVRAHWELNLCIGVLMLFSTKTIVLLPWRTMLP